MTDLHSNQPFFLFLLRCAICLLLEGEWFVMVVINCIK